MGRVAGTTAANATDVEVGRAGSRVAVAAHSTAWVLAASSSGLDSKEVKVDRPGRASSAEAGRIGGAAEVDAGHSFLQYY